jgi:hypothetical protein
MRGVLSVFLVFVVFPDRHNSSPLLYDGAEYSAFLDPVSLIKIGHRDDSGHGCHRQAMPRWRVASDRQLVFFRLGGVTGRFAKVSNFIQSGEYHPINDFRLLRGAIQS